VKHVDALFVLCVNFCTVVDQQLDETHVAVERSKVKGCETVFTPAVRVDPCLALFLFSLLPLLNFFDKRVLVSSVSAASMRS